MGIFHPFATILDKDGKYSPHNRNKQISQKFALKLKTREFVLCAGVFAEPYEKRDILRNALNVLDTFVLSQIHGVVQPLARQPGGSAGHHYLGHSDRGEEARLPLRDPGHVAHLQVSHACMHALKHAHTKFTSSIL